MCFRSLVDAKRAENAYRSQGHPVRLRRRTDSAEFEIQIPETPQEARAMGMTRDEIRELFQRVVPDYAALGGDAVKFPVQHRVRMDAPRGRPAPVASRSDEVLPWEEI